MQNLKFNQKWNFRFSGQISRLIFSKNHLIFGILQIEAMDRNVSSVRSIWVRTFTNFNKCRFKKLKIMKSEIFEDEVVTFEDVLPGRICNQWCVWKAAKSRNYAEILILLSVFFAEDFLSKANGHAYKYARSAVIDFFFRELIRSDKNDEIYWKLIGLSSLLATIRHAKTKTGIFGARRSVHKHNTKARFCKNGGGIDSIISLGKRVDARPRLRFVWHEFSTNESLN